MDEDLKSPVDSDSTVLSSAAYTEIGGRYRLLKWLGSGAMGAVHLAEDSKLHRQVAIKTVRAELSRSPEFCKRIERECVLHARVGAHQHIVTLFDKFEEAGQIHLVMEFIEGEPLQRILEENAEKRIVLPPTTSLTIAAQCLEALFRIHAHGIVHRDIKPANIMVTLDDSGETSAKLMDFGIARLMEGDEQFATLTSTNGGGPGTPLYMAPEQIDSKTFGPITYATDIYSMGILLYQMFSGRPPFTGTVTELLNAHVNLAPPPLHGEAQWTVPLALEDILKRALAKQPRDRFASAQEFRQHLMRIAGTLTNHPKTMSDTQIAESNSVYLDSAARQPAQDPLGSKGSTPGVLLPPKRRASNVIVPAAVVTALLFGAGAYWIVSSRLNTLPLEPPAAGASNEQNPVPETAPEPPAIPLDQALTAATPSAVTPVGAAAPALEPVTNTAGSAIRISELSAPSAGVPSRPPETLPVTSPSVDAALPVLGTPSVSPTAAAASNTTSMTLDGATKDAPTATQEYTIKPGDTLSKIADTNKVDVKDLQWWNGLKDPDNLLVGKTLCLYERPGLQPKDKFFASLPKPSVSAPPPEPPTSAQAPTESQEPAAPPADSEAKQPAKKKTIKEFFRGIFHK